MRIGYLDDEYDMKNLQMTMKKRRQAWLKEGAGDKTPELRRIDSEMVRRSNEKYERTS